LSETHSWTPCCSEANDKNDKGLHAVSLHLPAACAEELQYVAINYRSSSPPCAFLLYYKKQNPLVYVIKNMFKIKKKSLTLFILLYIYF